MVTWVALAVVPLSDVASLAMPATRSRQVTQVEVMQVQGVNTIQPNMYSFLAVTTKHEDGCFGAVQKIIFSPCQNIKMLIVFVHPCPTAPYLRFSAHFPMDLDGSLRIIDGYTIGLGSSEMEAHLIDKLLEQKAHDVRVFVHVFFHMFIWGF